MKKNSKLLLGIVWIAVAILCFCINKIVVGIPWLLIGLLNIYFYIMSHKIDKKANIKYTQNTFDDNTYEKVYDTIKVLDEESMIQNEYIGYGYSVNKAFKEAKSHACEVELLCTYAPNSEYGCEGVLPYIAVQIDDAVYCAVEEYKSTKSFNGAINLEQLNGKFMFRAKQEYYDDMMYFYGFEHSEDDYWDMAGLCLVYPKQYVGTVNEEKLMQILDKAAQSFKKINE